VVILLLKVVEKWRSPEDPNLDAQGQITDAEYQKDTKSAEI
jgi:hypothetical protein